MVPMHAEKSRKGAFHEPTLVWSPAFRRLRVARPAEAGTPCDRKFMVPMHGIQALGAFHEPAADQPTPDPSQEGNLPSDTPPSREGLGARSSSQYISK